MPGVACGETKNSVLTGEFARKDVERVGAHLHLLGRGIGDSLWLERPGVPAQLQGNEKLIFWLVAVDVKSGSDRNGKRLGDGCHAWPSTSGAG